MSAVAWHPADEGMAASNLAVFIEWLRASGRMVDADPARVKAWAAGRSAEFDAAMADFMGWPAGLPASEGEALVMLRADGRREAWHHDALPAWVGETLARTDAIDLAIFHVIQRNTRPDDRVLWMGGAAEALPLGALYFGATVILAEKPTPALAEAERALILMPRP